MEGRKFLIVVEDNDERANVKDICEARGSSVIAIDSPYEASRYIASLTAYNIVIIDVDSEEAIALCERVWRLRPETFIVGLRSEDKQDTIASRYCNAMLNKPLYRTILALVLDNNKI